MKDMNEFLDRVKFFFSSAEDFLLPFIKQFLTAIGPIVLAAAEQAVIAYAAQNMPGAQKKEGAYNQIVTELQKQGITVAASVVNSAIEAAVASIRSKG